MTVLKDPCSGLWLDRNGEHGNLQSERRLAEKQASAGQVPYQKWVAENLKIISEEGQLIPLVYTSSQSKINETWDRAKTEQEHLRLLILKCRRIRASTCVASRVFERGLRSDLKGQALTLASDERITDELYWITRRFRDNLMDCPPQLYSNRKEIIFAPPVDFRFTYQAGHEYAGTAATLHVVHITELAKWRDAQTTMGALMPAAWKADVVVESTANGMLGKGEYFYNMCKRAMAGENEWEFLFIPWFEHDEYLIPASQARFDRIMDEPLGDEERALQDAYDLTDEQLAWRRNFIATDYSGDVDMFRQDFPSSIDDAFLRVEGRRVFPIQTCRINKLKSAEPKAVGRLYWKVKPVLDSSGKCVNRKDLEVEFGHDENGPLRVWAFPPTEDEVITHRFVGAADIARGVEGGDSNSAVILDRFHHRIVATWHELCDASLFGEYLARLAVWYGAEIAPENNDAGHATVVKLLDLLGSDGAWASRKYEPGSNLKEFEAAKWGWKTTHANHELMVQGLLDVIREDQWVDPDEAFWTEAINVVREPSGKAHITGMDRVACRCILAIVDRLLPMAKSGTEKVERKDSYKKKRRLSDEEERARRIMKTIGIRPYKRDWRAM